MVKKMHTHQLNIPQDFEEEWKFFVEVSKTDTKVQELLAKSRANREQHISIALREVIKTYNAFKRKQLLGRGGVNAANRPVSPAQNPSSS